VLTVQQLQKIKNEDQYLFEALTKIVGALNHGFATAGIDPMPAAQADAQAALAPPAPPASIAVSVVAGIAFVVLTAAASNRESALYFVEVSSSADFSGTVTTYRIGHSLHLVIPDPAGTNYWRAYARYQMSGKSNYTVTITA
jgi:hypothetical protein